MFRILKNVIFLSLLLVLNLEAKEKELTNKQMLDFESLELFKKAGIKVEKAYDIGSLYLLSIVVQGNKDEIFLTKDKNYLISGAVINTSTGMQIKAPVNLAILKDKEALLMEMERMSIFFLQIQSVHIAKNLNHFYHK